MSVWIGIYANLVRNNLKTIEGVPEEFRQQVIEVLSKK